MAEAADPVITPPAARPIDGTRASDDPQAIAADIRHTRAEMDETIDAIGAKLDPSRLVDEAKGALTSKAHDLVDRASDAVSGGGGSFLGDLSSNRLVEAVKQNPLPAAAVGLSVAWFFSKLGESETDRYRRGRYATGYSDGPYDPSARRHAGSQTDGSDGESLADKASEAASTAKDKTAGLAGRVGDAASDLTDRVSGSASRAADGAQERAHGAVDSLQHAGHRAESWLDRQMHANPLAVGAVALAAGALVGLSVPETDAEHRLLGDRADEVKRQAAQAAREQAEGLADTVHEVTDKAKAKAEEVADEAKHMAGELADEAEQKADEATSSHPPVPPTGDGTPPTTGSSVDLSTGTGASGPGTTRPPTALGDQKLRAVVDLRGEAAPRTGGSGPSTPGQQDRV